MKKDEARCTLRFTPADPRHRVVMDTINAMGRRKASFIVDAVWDYLVRHGRIEAVANLPLDLASVQSGSMTANISSQSKEVMPNIEASAPETVDSNLQAERKHKDLPEEMAHDSSSHINGTAEMGTRGHEDNPLDVPYDNEMRSAVLGGLSMFTSSE